ncbi:MULTISPECIES: endolytic transglycosylase MltG [Shewanella]|uniref:endolytic transglycosylase MltG n=1 Tax=Shewanella TaxID=22 RepID=UPI001C65E2F8|nr:MULTISPECIES: endolytic transglycosylase MltG [Shewanella]QYJ73848.1 endolytic transglycosylase MltG [Shewanella sp. FJAT-52076]QYK03724.1 endolytic transglycosylase MltG [Shewanella zhangzhouensis]
MKRIFIGIVGAIMTLTLLGAVTALWGMKELETFANRPLMLEQSRELELNRGTNARALGKELVEQGLLEPSWHYDWYLRLNPAMAGIRQGLYEITPGDTVKSLLDKLISGKVKDFAITLVEGQTLREWQPKLETAPRLNWEADVFLKVLKANGDDSGLPEGKFFPDTYSYHANQDVEKLLTQSYLKMQQELAAAWQARAPDLPLASAYELLILASIIEKETGKAEERPLIAAVFINRLRKGMRLQTDPTVIYGMGERFNGNITRKDLREDTPFNTYRIQGLPPTPIAAPGREALMAAAQPAQSDYLYFVSRNDGSHVFSRTLAEHNRAVNQFQRKQK